MQGLLLTLVSAGRLRLLIIEVCLRALGERDDGVVVVARLPVEPLTVDGQLSKRLHRRPGLIPERLTGVIW